MRLPSLKQILRKKLFFVGEDFHAALTGGAKTVFAAGRLGFLALFRHPGDRFRAQEIDGGLTFQEVHRRVETLHVFFQFPHELFRRFLLLGRADRVEHACPAAFNSAQQLPAATTSFTLAIIAFLSILIPPLSQLAS